MPAPLVRTRAKASRKRRFSAATKTRTFSPDPLRAWARPDLGARRRESGADAFKRAVSLTTVSIIETPPLLPPCGHLPEDARALLIYNVARRLPRIKRRDSLTRAVRSKVRSVIAALDFRGVRRIYSAYFPGV